MTLPKISTVRTLIEHNWKAGVTVAFISVPLSIALSIASGAGPIPGLITGVWATLLASFFGGSNYNIIGAAGALTTVLFAATISNPVGLGGGVLPLIAIATGLIIFCIFILRADRFLYYIPSSVMYGFAAGVAFLIAASQLFDATGLSTLKRTGTFVGDIKLFIAHSTAIQTDALIVFALFLAAMLLLKRFVKRIPAVIPISLAGILFGYIETRWIPGIDLLSLGEKFGSFSPSLMVSVPWHAVGPLLSSRDSVLWLLKTAGTVSLIAVLETLITAKIGDKITKTQSSSRKELLGLALANIGSGCMGGLPATGVFIRTGANIKAGATHRTSATIAAIATAIVAVIVLPFFAYIPMVVIAAMLVNTAIGLIEVDIFVEFWKQEKTSFLIAVLVALITIFEDAGTGVLAGAILSLLFFADRVSHGRFDVILNFTDGSKEEHRGAKVLHLPHNKNITVVTYSIAGALGYIDSGQHSANLRHLAHHTHVENVIIRLRDLFTIDFEGTDMLTHAIEDIQSSGKVVYLSSMNPSVQEHLMTLPAFTHLKQQGYVCTKTSDALAQLGLRTTPQH